MIIINPGHEYELQNFEHPEKPGQRLRFIEKRPEDETSANLHTIRDGTTNEDVLRALIDRCRVLGDRLPSRENSIAVTKLEEALMWLERRTQSRLARGVEGTHKL